MEKLRSAAEQLGIFLTSQQLNQFELYYHELIDWNKRLNLTAITDYEGVQVKHFLDSLTVSAAVDMKKKGLKVVDIGTGAGFPGIPLKIVFPDIQLALLEATKKKTKFLEAAISKLDLKDVEIIAARAETAAHDLNYREEFDVVVSRALSALTTLAELMLPFCNIGGSCIVQKKGDINKEVEQSAKAIALMGGKLKKVIKLELKEFNNDRLLVIVDKIKSTPAEYPRRPGIPRKTPIIS